MTPYEETTTDNARDIIESSFPDLIRRIRAYDPEQVPQELVDELIDTAVSLSTTTTQLIQCMESRDIHMRDAVGALRSAMFFMLD